MGRGPHSPDCAHLQPLGPCVLALGSWPSLTESTLPSGEGTALVRVVQLRCLEKLHDLPWVTQLFGGPKQRPWVLLRPPEGGPSFPSGLLTNSRQAVHWALAHGPFEEANMSAGKALRLCGTSPRSASFPSTCLWSECPGRPQATCLCCVVGAGNGSLEAPWGHLSGWHGRALGRPSGSPGHSPRPESKVTLILVHGQARKRSSPQNEAPMGAEAPRPSWGPSSRCLTCSPRSGPAS